MKKGLFIFTMFIVFFAIGIVFAAGNSNIKYNIGDIEETGQKTHDGNSIYGFDIELSYSYSGLEDEFGGPGCLTQSREILFIESVIVQFIIGKIADENKSVNRAERYYEYYSRYPYKLLEKKVDCDKRTCFYRGYMQLKIKSK